MKTLHEILQASASGHKQLCPRQVLGARMGMLAGQLLIIISLVSLASCTLAPAPGPAGPVLAPAPTAAATNADGSDIARPSNPGGPGPALGLKGDPERGEEVFKNCMPCHGNQGKGGVVNPGSADGTVPSLNPIDPTMVSNDPKLFAYNIDLFVEHASTPDGPNPTFKMVPWGDSKQLTPQQIADVIAYVMSLNQ